MLSLFLAPPAGITGITQTTNFNNPNTLLGDITSRVLIFAVSLAGMIFLYKLVMGGFGYLTSAGDPAKIQSSTKEITNGLIGLLIITTAFFLIQIAQTVFGIKII